MFYQHDIEVDFQHRLQHEILMLMRYLKLKFKYYIQILIFDRFLFLWTVAKTLIHHNDEKISVLLSHVISSKSDLMIWKRKSVCVFTVCIIFKCKWIPWKMNLTNISHQPFCLFPWGFLSFFLSPYRSGVDLIKIENCLFLLEIFTEISLIDRVWRCRSFRVWVNQAKYYSNYLIWSFVLQINLNYWEANKDLWFY